MSPRHSCILYPVPLGVVALRSRTALTGLVILSLLTAASIFAFRSYKRQTEAARAAAIAGEFRRQQLVERAERADSELALRLDTICRGSGGTVGVAVAHVETGRTVAVHGSNPLPLFSVFKLPLAISVLKAVEEGRLNMDQKLLILPSERTGGSVFNNSLWRVPVERSIAELIELSIVRSDNTSTDKLLELIGGPAVLTEQMRSLGLNSLDIQTPVKHFVNFTKDQRHPNTGSAEDLVGLLIKLQKGELLQAEQSDLLLGLMGRAMTGLRRLRADLPPGTFVADKTGSGLTATNDVGLITLPDERGHLAMAVLVHGSPLTLEKQEKLIAEMARAAYDSYVTRTPDSIISSD